MQYKRSFFTLLIIASLFTTKIHRLQSTSQKKFNDPLPSIFVFRMKGDKFVFQGTMVTISKKDLRDINSRNYLSSPYPKPSHLVDGYPIAAIILGTTDKEVLEKFKSDHQGN